MPNITNPHVKLAFETIKAKKPLYDELYKYYTGFHPLRYSTNKLKKVFEAINVYFSENWLGVIVDSVIDRLVLKGFDISDNTAAKTKLDDMWRDHNMMLIAEDVHEAVTITNEAFVIAMKIEDEDTGAELLEVFHNDPRMCHVFYDANQPDKKEFAAKLWQSNDGYIHLTLYYKDRFEHYRSLTATKPGVSISSYKQLQPDPDGDIEDNPFDTIPVFHWVTSKTTKKRDMGPSEISMQDAINKLLSDMMVSSEFNSYVQRVIISKADPGNMPNEPGANWWLPASDEGQQTTVTELGGRVLDGFLNAIDKLATSLAIISRTPKHYFFAQTGDPSGEALIAMEAPLNKKVKKRQGRYAISWQDLAQFLLELEDIKIDKKQIVPMWEPAETVQPQTSATITKTQVDSGVPLKTSLRWQGKTADEIKQLEEDQKEEQTKRTGLAQDALDQLRAEDARNNANSTGGTNVQA